MNVCRNRYCWRSSFWAGLLLAVLVALVEFVHAAGGVDELHLSGIERMGGVGDLDLHEGIGHALDVDGLPGVDTGAGDEHMLIGHILESYKTVGFGMYTFFHCVKIKIVAVLFWAAKVYTISFPSKFSTANFRKLSSDSRFSLKKLLFFIKNDKF